jgi:hypothetical protein
LWEKLDEPSFDVHEFGDLFSKAEVNKKTNTEKLVKVKKSKEVNSSCITMNNLAHAF